MMHDQNKMRGLYFPYAFPRTTTALKFALLAFDELWFIDPLSRDYRWTLMYTEYGSAWDEIRVALDFLMDRGLVKIYDPRPLLQERDAELSDAISRDLRDPVYSSISDVMVGGRWSVALERLPPSLRTPEYSHNAVHGFLPVFDGFVLNLNIALAIADSNANVNLVPVTDCGVAQHALSLKYAQATETAPRLHLTLPCGQVKARTDTQMFKYNVLAVTVLHDLVPHQVLDSLSVREVIKYRDEASEAMSAFKIRLFELTHRLTAEPTSPTFSSQALSVLDSVRAEEQRLTSELRKISTDLVRDVAAGALSGTIPALTACIYSNCSYGQMLSVSSAVLAAAGIKAVADVFKGKAALNNNALSFLINLRSKSPFSFSRWANGVLRSRKAPEKQHIRYLKRALQNKDEDVRRLAVGALISVGSQAAIEVLKDSLCDTDSVVRHRAIAALSRSGSSLSTSEWTHVLKRGEDATTVLTAIKALCRIGSRAALSTVLTEILSWPRDPRSWNILAESRPPKELLIDVAREIVVNNESAQSADFVSRACWLIASQEVPTKAEEAYWGILNVSHDELVCLQPIKHLLRSQRLAKKSVTRIRRMANAAPGQKRMMLTWLLLGLCVEAQESRAQIEEQLQRYAKEPYAFFEEKTLLNRMITGNTLKGLDVFIDGTDDLARSGAILLLTYGVFHDLVWKNGPYSAEPTYAEGNALAENIHFKGERDDQFCMWYAIHRDDMRRDLDALRDKHYGDVLRNKDWLQDNAGHLLLGT